MQVFGFVNLSFFWANNNNTKLEQVSAIVPTLPALVWCDCSSKDSRVSTSIVLLTINKNNLPFFFVDRNDKRLADRM